jgi:FSR family fosmidomycin resistance protein-like MFS transporter
VATAALRTDASGLGRRLGPLTFGHAAVDFAQGAVPALLPFLKDEHDLSYLQIGALVLAMTVSSSLVQPVFGGISDRGGGLWLMPAGIFASALGIGLIAVAPEFWTVFACILVSGVGVAAYHPPATRSARDIAYRAPATGMSIFSVGGNVGVAAGPALAGLAAAAFGLAGTALCVLPGLVGVIVLTRFLPTARAEAEAHHARSVGRRAAAGDRPRAFGMLLGQVMLRGYVYFGLLAFVPLFEEQERGRSAAYGALLLTLMLAAGAVGTLGVGRIADRVGVNKVMLGATALVAPTTALYLLDDGLLGVVGLLLAGASMIATFTVAIVMSQRYMPSRPATAAGLSIGLSMGIGGVASVGIGAIADATGLETALLSCVVIGVVATALTAVLPDADR